MKLFSANHGFALAEVLGAAAILVLVMTSLAGILRSSYRLTGENHGRVSAIQALREEMESLRAMDFGEVSNLPNGSAFVNAPMQELVNSSGTRTIADIVPGELRQVTLRVDWEDGWGRGLSEELTTFFGEGGLTG